MLLSMVGGRVNAGQFKSFIGFDGIIFTQLTHLNPEFSDFLTDLKIPFVSIGAPAGCSVMDSIDHRTFDAQTVLLRRLVRAGYRRIELWHPAVVPGEWERRKKRWRILKRSLGLPLLSGDEALYDWSKPLADSFPDFAELHEARGDWPEVVILWHKLTPERAVEARGRIPRGVLCLSGDDYGGVFVPFTLGNLACGNDRKILAEFLFRRIIFPDHPPMREKMKITVECSIPLKKSNCQRREKNVLQQNPRESAKRKSYFQIIKEED